MIMLLHCISPAMAHIPRPRHGTSPTAIEGGAAARSPLFDR
jgi:hypothetical protein